MRVKENEALFKSDKFEYLKKQIQSDEPFFGGNIFNVLGISSHEVPITSFLAYLLNPNGSHMQGDRFLKSFLANDNVDIRDLKATNVFTEFVVKGHRRIDILLDNPLFKRIIEVKIYAKDQPSQLCDYLNDIRFRYLKCINVKAIYLTLFGSKPSEQSLKSSSGNIVMKEGQDYVCMSFSNDVLRMLDCFNYENNHLMNNYFNNNFKQFKEVVMKLTGCNSDTVNATIEQIIFQNKTSFDTCKSIYNYFNNVHNQKYSLGQEIFWNYVSLFEKIVENECWKIKKVNFKDSNNVFYETADKIVVDDKYKVYFCISKSINPYTIFVGYIYGPKVSGLEVSLPDSCNAKIKQKFENYALDEQKYTDSDSWCRLDWSYIPNSNCNNPVFDEDNKNLDDNALNFIGKPREVEKYIKACLVATLKIILTKYGSIGMGFKEGVKDDDYIYDSVSQVMQDYSFEFPKIEELNN